MARLNRSDVLDSEAEGSRTSPHSTGYSFPTTQQRAVSPVVVD